jgi:excisionase family DNA binding protein
MDDSPEQGRMTLTVDVPHEIVETIARRVLELTREEQQEPSGAWLDTAGAAEYLGMPKTTLHKLTAARGIPFEQEGPGCKLYFKRSDLDTWRRRGGGRASR